MAFFFLNLILLILVFPHYADSQTSHIDQYRILGAEMGRGWTAVKHVLSCMLTMLHWSYKGLLQNFHLFVLLKNICMYLFGCASLSCSMWDLRSSLQHVGPSIFIAACGISVCGMHTLSCSVWDPVPRPGIKPRPLCLGSTES